MKCVSTATSVSLLLIVIINEMKVLEMEVSPLQQHCFHVVPWNKLRSNGYLGLFREFQDFILFILLDLGMLLWSLILHPLAYSTQ